MINSGGAHEFACKRCKKPLEIDTSITEYLKNVKDLDAALPLDTSELLKTVHHFHSDSDLAVGDSGLDLVQDSTVPNSDPMGRRVMRRARTNLSNTAAAAKVVDMFQLASDETEIDHPLCVECTERIIEELETELKEVESENAIYSKYIAQLSQEDTQAVQAVRQYEQEISSLEEEEKAIREKLLLIEEERKRLKKEKLDLERDSEKLQNIEKLYWQNFNDFQTKLSAFKEERDAVRMSIEKANNQLELLKKTNLYNDAFHIWHDGHFGTINSFRLGDLPSRNVPWDEINAAWGQATLLLYTIAKKLNFKFSTYRLVPMGSNSKVVKLDDQSTYELYGSNDYMLTKLLWYGRYDKAMLAFLHCLKELGDHAENEDKHFRLPYRMDRDKIGEMSIKHNQYNTETWTKALKYMLTNLKWLLAWLARRGDNLPE